MDLNDSEDPSILDIHAEEHDEFLTADEDNHIVNTQPKEMCKVETSPEESFDKEPISPEKSMKSKKISLEEYRKLQQENEQLKKQMGLNSPNQEKMNVKEEDEDNDDDDDDEPLTPSRKTSSEQDNEAVRLDRQESANSLSKDLINISTDEEGDQLNDDNDGLQDEDNDGKRTQLSPIEWMSDDDPGLDSDEGLNEDDEELDSSPKTKSQSEKKIQSIAERRDVTTSGEKRGATPPPTLPQNIKYIFKETRYFMIKSNNHENVNLSKQHSIWATPRSNEYRLNRAFAETRNVLLIFSVKESGHFQGYARLSAISSSSVVVNWVLPPGLTQWQLSGGFKIDWISRCDLPFSKTTALINEWNERKPVKIGRDGQEIEPGCGEALCRLFTLDKDCPLDSIVEKSKRTKRDPKLLSQIERKKKDNYRLPYSSGFNNPQGQQSRRRDGDRYHQRGRSPGYPMVNPDIFINGNYQDYIHQAQQLSRRGYPYHSMPYPVYQDQFPSFDNSRFYSGGHGSRDRDKHYEERVDDFLRGIGSRRGGGGNDYPPPHHHRHQMSRNYSPPPHQPPYYANYSPSPPPEESRRSRSRELHPYKSRYMRDRGERDRDRSPYSRSQSRERR